MLSYLLRCVLCLSLCSGAVVAQSLQLDGQASVLTADQSASFAAARRSFGAGQWAAALQQLRPLHESVPGNALVAKFTAEAAINSGDSAYAMQVLQQVLTAAPDDWQALTLQARLFAEAHDEAARDSALRRLTELHATSADQGFSQQTQVLMERDALPSGHLDIFYSLQPWSRYNIYEMARVYGADNKQTLRVTLESSDFDQPLWAKQHPDLAAKGERMFSMDGYSDQPAATPGGQATQTHMTFAFFDGRPSYDVVRSRMIAIASGKGQVPMTKTEGIMVKP